MSIVAPAPPRADPPAWLQLRWRLLAAFVALATLPILAVALITLTRVESQTSALVVRQLESVATLKQSAIERWLSDLQQELQLLAVGPNRGRLELLLRNEIFTMADQLRANALLAEAVFLNDPRKMRPSFETIFIYNPDGLIVAASDEGLNGRQVAGQPYYSVSQTEPFVVAPFYQEGRARPTLAIGYPLRDTGGRLLGVMIGEADLDILGEIMLDRSGLGATGETYLVSREDNHLLTPSRGSADLHAQPYTSAGIERALNGESGSDIYVSGGQSGQYVIGVYRWLPQLQAALMAEVDENEALAVYTETAEISWGGAAVAGILALLSGLLVAASIVRPLSALTAAARQIAEGDLSRRARVAGRHEIGALADSFNQMAEQLQATLAGLEREVGERTAEAVRARVAAEAALADLRASLSERDQLSATVRALSNPVLPVLEGVLVVPLVGAIDAERAAEMRRAILAGVERERARFVILDVTGVPLVDAQVARALIDVGAAARLIGARAILAGVRPELAEAIVSLGVDLGGITALANLESAVRYAARGA